MATQHWENEEPITGRTKIALRVLLLMFRILSPYKFSHEFEDSIKRIEKEIGDQ